MLHIVRACITANSFEALEKLIKDAWDTEKASDYIITAAANAQQPIDSSHSPNGGQSSGISTADIYARRKSKVVS